MALTFDRTSDEYAVVPDHVDLDGVSAFSFSFWLRLPDVTTVVSYSIVRKYNGSTQPYTIRFDGSVSGARLLFGLTAGGSGANFISNTLGQYLSTNKWYLITCSYNGVAGRVRAYFNTTLAISDVKLGTLAANNADVYIGRLNTASSENLTGGLFDLRYYKRELSFEEIQTICNSHGNDNITSSGLRLPMSEKNDGALASGANSIIDVSIGNKPATPYNNPVYVPAPLKVLKG